jgi:HlyD family type I secretion membrane fusion protein
MKAEQVRPSGLSNTVFYVIGLFFITAVAWAFYTEIDQVIRAEARVEPTGKVQVVQNRYPGSIDHFNLQIGDQVKQGDVLFWLKQEETDAAIQTNRITYYSVLAQQARFASEANGSSLHFDAVIPEDIVAKQKSIYDAKQESLSKQVQIIKQEMASKQNSILQAQAAAKGAIDSLSLVIEEIAIYEPLVKAGIEPKVRLINLQKQKQEASNGIKQQVLAEAGFNIEIDTLQRKQQQLMMDFQIQAKEQYAEATNVTQKTVAEYNALVKKQSMTEVKAPASGIISALHVTTQGAVVGAGETLAEIVPAADTYMVLAKVKPEDISLITTGQACKISFTAYDFAKFGSMPGEIVTIAQNITETQQGEMFYEVWVKTLSKQFSKSTIQPNIMPGMIAQVDVLGEKQRIVDYIMTPLRRTASIALTEQ